MKGHISIGQYSNYRNEDNLSVYIQVEDEISGTRFLEVRMTPEDFGRAVLGLGFTDCEFELRSKNVGKIHERKTEEVYLQHGAWKISDESKRALLSPYEVDGWVGYLPDLGNHHKIIKQDKDGAYYKVGFTRFVDAPVPVE